MEVPVGDAARGLSRKARRIEVVDLAGLRVEEIEGVEIDLDARVEDVADAAVESRGEARPDAAVGNQRARPQAAHTQRAEEARVGPERDARRTDEVRRARDQ